MPTSRNVSESTVTLAVQLNQLPNHHIVIHLFSAPVGDAGFSGNIDAGAGAVLGHQAENISAETRRWRLGDGFALGVAERWAGRWCPFLRPKPPSWMRRWWCRHRVDQVVEFGLATVRPVLDVMGVDVFVGGAAGGIGSPGRVSGALFGSTGEWCGSCGRYPGFCHHRILSTALPRNHRTVVATFQLKHFRPAPAWIQRPRHRRARYRDRYAHARCKRSPPFTPPARPERKPSARRSRASARR